MSSKLWEEAVEQVFGVVARFTLRDPQQLARFAFIRMRYDEVCRKFLAGDAGSHVISDGYDWTTWAGALRATFALGVPLGFLSNATLRHTMVFGQRRGIVHATERIAVAARTYDEATLRALLREDSIGRPRITTLRYLTSANRAHHVAHLAEYSAATGKKFWEHDTILEWGGGYGNMARVVRRANPGLTYVIADLAEVLALQYVYLTSCAGEQSVHVVDPAAPSIARGKVNLMTSRFLLEQPSLVRADAFLSTWALTESPREAQVSVIRNDLFGARSLLVAAKRDGNNAFGERFRATDVMCRKVPTSRGLVVDNDYWFR